LYRYKHVSFIHNDFKTFHRRRKIVIPLSIIKETKRKDERFKQLEVKFDSEILLSHFTEHQEKIKSRVIMMKDILQLLPDELVTIVASYTACPDNPLFYVEEIQYENDVLVSGFSTCKDTVIYPGTNKVLFPEQFGEAYSSCSDIYSLFQVQSRFFCLVHSEFKKPFVNIEISPIIFLS